MVVVGVVHFVLSKLNDLALLVHQKSMADEDLESMAFMASIGMGNEGAPMAWHVLTNITAVLFWASSGAAIYYFLVM